MNGCEGIPVRGSGSPITLVLYLDMPARHCPARLYLYLSGGRCPTLLRDSETRLPYWKLLLHWLSRLPRVST